MGFPARPIALLLVSLLVPACARRPEPLRQVVIVTIDTLRSDHLPCYGYPRATAPFLSRLAREGVVFEHAFTASAHTAPSHASLFTGLFPYQHGLRVNGAQLPPGTPTLAALWAARGFATAGFAGVGFLEGLAQGFQHFEAQHFSPERRPSAADVLGAAERWLRLTPPERRFLLWIHLYDVHEWAHDSPLYAGDEAALRAEPGPAGETLGAWLEEHQALSLPRLARRGGLAAVDRYDARILHVDAALSRLFELVQARFLGPVLWVITADHGEGLGAHGYLGHGREHWREQLQVPLLLWFSDGRYGPVRVPQLVRSVDLLASLAELADAPEALAGAPGDARSWLPLLRGAARDYPVDAAFAERRPPEAKPGWQGDRFSLHTLRHKLVIGSASPEAFFDLERDPLEQHELPAADEVPERTQLRQRLEAVVREARARSAARPEPAFSPEHEAELRALGYVE